MNFDQGYRIAAIVIAFSLGYLLHASFGANEQVLVQYDHHDEPTAPHDHMDLESEIHMHEKFNIAEGDTAPTIAIKVSKDPKAGYNLQILTTNFTFSPEQASTEHIDGTGHAHLYIDGKKITRVYGEWIHIDDLMPGDHEILVTLNTNDHKDYMINNEQIADSVIISVE